MAVDPARVDRTAVDPVHVDQPAWPEPAGYYSYRPARRRSRRGFEVVTPEGRVVRWVRRESEARALAVHLEQGYRQTNAA
jgi:hypothetical protein